MSRTRSLRPKKPSPSQQVESLLRTLGRTEPVLLEAALEGADVRQVLESMPDEPIAELVVQAQSVCLDAYAIWQRCSTMQRTTLRGFSTSLLALAAEQSLNLERSHAEFLRLDAERSEASLVAQKLRERNTSLCAQARAVLEKVTGDAALVRAELDDGSDANGSVSEFARRVERFGRSILAKTEAAIRARSRLYGLDASFLDAIIVACKELEAIERRATSYAGVQECRAKVELAQTATFILVRQIAEAFEVAHSIDRQIATIASAAKAPASPRVPTSNSARGAATFTEGSRRERVVAAPPPLRVIDPKSVEHRNRLLRRG